MPQTWLDLSLRGCTSTTKFKQVKTCDSMNWSDISDSSDRKKKITISSDICDSSNTSHCFHSTVISDSIGSSDQWGQIFQITVRMIQIIKKNGPQWFKTILVDVNGSRSLKMNSAD